MGKISEQQRMLDRSLPETEIFQPARAITRTYRGELQILALELVAKRDHNRHMCLPQSQQSPRPQQSHQDQQQQ